VKEEVDASGSKLVGACWSSEESRLVGVGRTGTPSLSHGSAAPCQIETPDKSHLKNSGIWLLLVIGMESMLK
jgi:hypothetical protein